MKYYGPFTKAATAALKKADRLICAVKDGRIYLTDGLLALVMTPGDYDVIARPATGRDPGNWTIAGGAVTPGGASVVDTVEKIRAAVMDDPACRSYRMPGTFSYAGKQLAAYYNDCADVVTMVVSPLADAFSGDGLRYASNSERNAVVVLAGPDDNPVMVGLVMPMALQGEIAPRIKRSVRAYFRDDGAGSAGVDDGRADRLQRSVDRLRDDLADKNREIDSLKAELEKLKTAAGDAKSYAVKSDAAKKDGSAADRAGEVAGRLCELDGLQVVVNGATTATPVVWISGDVNAHADAIRAEGGKYSVKKGAYYIKIV